MAPRYRRREQEENIDPYKQTELPINQPCVVYYRQSSEAQIGNISTTMQTVDMVEHLMSLGWVQESIIMIDRDAGLSGSKIIEDLCRLLRSSEHDSCLKRPTGSHDVSHPELERVGGKIGVEQLLAVTRMG